MEIDMLAEHPGWRRMEVIERVFFGSREDQNRGKGRWRV